MDKSTAEAEPRRALLLFGGDLCQKPSDQTWQSQDRTGPGNEHGPIFCRNRIVAASKLYLKRPVAIIVSGDKADPVVGKPSYAKVARQEMIDRGVNEDWIIADGWARDTFEDLMAFAWHAEDIGLTEAICLSNGYHLGRIKALVEHGGPKNELCHLRQISMSYLSAEEIIVNSDASLKGGIDSMMNDPRMQDRLSFEEKGIADIAAERYKWSNRRYRPSTA